MIYILLLLFIIIICSIVRYRETFDDDVQLEEAGGISTNQLNYQDAISATKAINKLTSEYEQLKNKKTIMETQITTDENTINDLTKKIYDYTHSKDYIEQEKSFKEQIIMIDENTQETIDQCQGGPDIIGDTIYNVKKDTITVQEEFIDYKKEVAVPREIALDCQNQLKSLGYKINIVKQEIKVNTN